MSAMGWPKGRADSATARILLDIYQEFVYRQRDQRMWEAGWETICAIGPFPELERHGEGERV